MFGLLSQLLGEKSGYAQSLQILVSRISVGSSSCVVPCSREVVACSRLFQGTWLSPGDLIRVHCPGRRVPSRVFCKPRHRKTKRRVILDSARNSESQPWLVCSEIKGPQNQLEGQVSFTPTTSFRASGITCLHLSPTKTSNHRHTHHPPTNNPTWPTGHPPSSVRPSGSASPPTMSREVR
jgi:hypothetical protein